MHSRTDQRIAASLYNWIRIANEARERIDLPVGAVEEAVVMLSIISPTVENGTVIVVMLVVLLLVMVQMVAVEMAAVEMAAAAEEEEWPAVRLHGHVVVDAPTSTVAVDDDDVHADSDATG